MAGTSIYAYDPKEWKLTVLSIGSPRMNGSKMWVMNKKAFDQSKGKIDVTEAQ